MVTPLFCLINFFFSPLKTFLLFFLRYFFNFFLLFYFFNVFYFRWCFLTFLFLLVFFFLFVSAFMYIQLFCFFFISVCGLCISELQALSRFVRPFFFYLFLLYVYPGFSVFFLFPFVVYVYPSYKPCRVLCVRFFYQQITEKLKRSTFLPCLRSHL